ncbi:MAG TPA: hypothetical protein VMU39_22705 [Solirubrobacteraceae bacterium]|nr:hypothetical protein [Solirubrobacteraceae bacterium]
MPVRQPASITHRIIPGALAVLAALLLLLGAAPGARADGDPASDVLLGENVFYPYTPPVTAALQKTLNAATAAARTAGFPLKVALIASPVDLGVIPDLFNKPQRYATFLDQEISFRAKQPLLVVMPAGYGIEGLNAKAAAAAASLPKPAGATSNDLAQAAVTAVAKLADASGHPLKGVSGVPGSSASGSSSSTVIVIVLAVAALIVAAALAVITLRRRGAGAHP